MVGARVAAPANGKLRWLGPGSAPGPSVGSGQAGNRGGSSGALIRRLVRMAMGATTMRAHAGRWKRTMAGAVTGRWRDIVRKI